MPDKRSLRLLKQSPAGILNIAHRGARAFAPENTLAAFRKAKSFGCQMFEMDVRLSKDGELVVHHDEQLTRCTDAIAKFPDRDSYAIRDFTYLELSTLDAGSWYSDQLSLPAPQRQAFLQSLTDEEMAQYISPQERELYACGKIRLPTLKQTLAFARDAGMMVNIELKTEPDRSTKLADAVVALVDSMKMDHNILISSFDHDDLVQVRKLSESHATGVLTTERTENLNGYLHLLDADAYHPSCYSEFELMGTRLLNLEGITDVRKAGRSVNVWTCNNKDDMRQLIAAGVTGLISDYPNRVRDVMLEYQHKNLC